MDYTTYHRIRQAHPTLTARDAYRYAQQEQQEQQMTPSFDWQIDRNFNRHTTFEVDGFHVQVTVESDYDHDWLDARGKFTSTWQEGAVRNPSRRYDPHVYEWFIPENTEEEHYKGLRDLNYGKAEARELAHSYVLEDMKIAADPEAAGYWATWVQVKASKEGVTLGESSLGGIELTYKDDSFLTTCAWECIQEAVHTAQKTLAKLVEKAAWTLADDADEYEEEDDS